ncbi:unnamed protein product [Didymodactylos carnosus]|uniref:Pyridoxal kinase n=1 Tax=Didymodactylos carnosus TaxID=1234261 RepID=A0A8S2CPH1_9BILA|nr:unnamed protein product [Didymodactylos carnosus]CAF3549567.1 unnamed protein product [Didymodactylos carnosus]
MTNCSPRAPRVLSIQSHVVHGYVGNKCATFILQLYGFEVDLINSVQFSNHTAYKVVKGSRLSVDELREIFQGLIDNDLLDYDYILTGYMSAGELLRTVADYIRLIKQKNPKVKYVCDPVIGDGGKLYVDRSCIDAYKNNLLPLADIVTPNDFEFEQLIDSKINYANDTDVIESMKRLHKMGPSQIVMSKTNYSMFRIEFPKIPFYFTGTGDTFSALLLAWIHKQNELNVACEKTISVIYKILLRTSESSGSEKKAEAGMCSNELCLIQSKKDIEDAETLFFAKTTETILFRFWSEMNAFETELGVQPELAKAVDDMGWLLPTDVQSEAIPMILGGGDVLMAAETGSGKTGAFCLPILQVVHETLRDIQEGNMGPKSSRKGVGDVSKAVLLNFHDRTQNMSIDTDGLLCQSRDQKIWGGARSNKGVKGKGKYYFEMTQTEANGIARVGWSTSNALLDLGTDDQVSRYNTY